MISRIVSCTVKRDKVNEFRNTLKNELLPKITRERGFVDVIESIDNGTGTFVCTTFWNSRQDVEQYDKGLFQEIAQRLMPMLDGQPDIKTLNVENSTVHDISAGKGAAA